MAGSKDHRIDPAILIPREKRWILVNAGLTISR